MKRSRPRRGEHRFDKPASVAAFKTWLIKCGAELLAPTNPYEVVRFRSGSGISIVYRCDRTQQNSMTNQAQTAWNAFRRGETLDLSVLYVGLHSRPQPSTDAALVEHAAAGPITIAFVMSLDLITTREATSRLRCMERAGLLTCRIGGRGRPLTWSAVRRDGDEVVA